MDENGWEVWRKYVLKELGRINEVVEKVDQKNDKAHAEINETVNGIKEGLTLMRIKMAGISIVVTIVIAVIANIVITAVKGG